MKRRKIDKTRDLFAGRYMVWFFAGGESSDDKFNVFTGSFIRFMKQILGEDFELVRGIYFSMPMLNVAWALNNSQFPISDPRKNRITEVAMQHMILTQSSLSSHQAPEASLQLRLPVTLPKGTGTG